jgi:hypothetical protein
MVVCDMSKMSLEDAAKLLKGCYKTSIMVIDPTPSEKDAIKDMEENVNLRGYSVSLIIKDESENMQKMQMQLHLPPMENQIIRHQDKYYRILTVIQSTSFGIAVVATKVSIEDIIDISNIKLDAYTASEI